MARDPTRPLITDSGGFQATPSSPCCFYLFCHFYFLDFSVLSFWLLSVTFSLFFALTFSVFSLLLLFPSPASLYPARPLITDSGGFQARPSPPCSISLFSFVLLSVTRADSRQLLLLLVVSPYFVTFSLFSFLLLSVTISLSSLLLLLCCALLRLLLLLLLAPGNE